EEDGEEAPGPTDPARRAAAARRAVEQHGRPVVQLSHEAQQGHGQRDDRRNQDEPSHGYAALFRHGTSSSLPIPNSYHGKRPRSRGVSGGDQLAGRETRRRRRESSGRTLARKPRSPASASSE